MTRDEIPEFKKAPTCDGADWNVEPFHITPAESPGVPAHDDFVKLRNRYSGRMRIGYTGPAKLTPNSPTKIRGNPPLNLENTLMTFKTSAETKQWKRPYINDTDGNEYQITGIDGDVVVCTPKANS